MLLFKKRYNLLQLSTQYRLPKIYDLLDNIKRPNKSINVEKEFPTEKNTKTNYLSESYLNNNQKHIEINKRPNYRKINNNISKNNNNAQKKEEKLTISSLIDKYSNDIRDVTDKDFDIFDFKKKVGYKNVLPMIGHVLLKTLGLIDSRIISIEWDNSLDRLCE